MAAMHDIEDASEDKSTEDMPECIKELLEENKDIMPDELPHASTTEAGDRPSN